MRILTLLGNVSFQILSFVEDVWLCIGISQAKRIWYDLRHSDGLQLVSILFGVDKLVGQSE
jgi:hypothetical protein